jgi:cyclophilin family peptidyl-prolyl cis-trans isomerase
LAAQAAAEAKSMRRRQAFTFVLVVALVGVLGAMIFGGYLAGGNSQQADTTDTSAATLPVTTLPPTTFADPVNVTLPPTGESITGETPCPPADGSAARTTHFEQPPPMCIDTSMSYEATIHTSAGDLHYLLADDSSPNTVNNFVVLSRYHYYDGLPFYRIVPNMMILTGDATGDPGVGQGGAGYTIDDEIPDVGVLYVPGSLHAWTDEENANRGQLLISAGEEAMNLPSHSLIGTLLDGDDALRAIEDKGTPSGQPSGEVTITSIDITEKPDPSASTSSTAGEGG